MNLYFFANCGAVFEGVDMEISILLLTYNHARFIRKALDGIVKQKISVSYEVIILDDASTDETPKILKEYKKKYPQIISLYLRTVNSDWPTKNCYFLLSKAQGKYYAFIEGDDYWIDDLKIQKQYDFLETHNEYSACVTDIVVVDEEGNKIEEQLYHKKENHIFTLEDFRHIRQPGNTVSFFSRNYFDKENYRIIYEADKMMGDITAYMLCLLKGNIYQMDEAMAVRRCVRKAGKQNFNSIHQGNIYRDYMEVQYFIQLENYMRQYNSEFEFAPMADNIKGLAKKYSVRPMIKLLMSAEQRKKYLLIYFVQRFLLDSNNAMEVTKNRKINKCYFWRQFINEKKSIIIFGAGAAAVEYIDKYAWKGNISFLVDNDKKKQDTSMKGFLIKKPEEIMKYKDKKAVLITSKFYEKDIEEQLQKMGVENYYCYCSMQANRIRNRIANILEKIYTDDSE